MVPREAVASAAVVLEAVTLLPAVPPAVLAQQIARGLWPSAGVAPSATAGMPLGPAHANGSAHRSTAGDCQDRGLRSSAAEGVEECHEEGSAVGYLEASLRAQGSTLEAELAKIRGVSQVCALRGLVSVLPKAVLCMPLALAQGPGQAHPAPPAGHSVDSSAQHSLPSTTSPVGTAAAAPSTSAAHEHDERRGRHVPDQAAGISSSAQRQREPGGPERQASWCMLMDGAIPTACQAIALAPDAHYKLHAVSLLAQSLLRCKDCLEVRC